MRRCLIALLLSLNLSTAATAETIRVRCECERTLTTLSSTDAMIDSEDLRQLAVLGRIKPILFSPRITKVIALAEDVEPGIPLQTFLKRWTDDARDLQEVRVGVDLIHYDKANLTETRGTGEIGVRPGYRGWMRIEGVKVDPREVQIGNERYTRKEAKPVEWYITDQLMYMVNREAKTYQTILAPWRLDATEMPSRDAVGEMSLFKHYPDLRLMFLIPSNLEDMQTRFEISLAPTKAGQVQLKLKPRTHWDSFDEIQVIIDANSLRTMSVKVDNLPTQSVVYNFTNKRVVRHPKKTGPIPVPDLKGFQDLTRRRNTEPEKPEPKRRPDKIEKKSGDVSDNNPIIYLNILKAALLGCLNLTSSRIARSPAHRLRRPGPGPSES